MIFADWTIPPPDEDGVDLNYFFNGIVFETFGEAEVAMLKGIRTEGSLIDFRRVSPPPKDIATTIESHSIEEQALLRARGWTEAAWGTMYNAVDTELVELDGRMTLRFTTMDPPKGILQALARQHPDAAWRYYGIASHYTHAADGQARDGDFTGDMWEPMGSSGIGDRAEACYRAIFGEPSGVE